MSCGLGVLGETPDLGFAGRGDGPGLPDRQVNPRTTTQFLVTMPAYGLHERFVRKAEYLREGNRVLESAPQTATAIAGDAPPLVVV